ncbi:UNVERIFIED_CONTAM: hypothetical protein Sradi_1525100 [Sesamum radiatum]|uniref:Uncharacterized protein n=1 Tax=Sesamum radiatum TaxID=300843 RepID=A0AAW2U8T9_SESRA
MMVSGRLAEERKRELADVLGISLVRVFDKYLGLPVVGRRSRGALFRNVRDRVWERVNGWNTKLLSQAGKGVFHKSVLQSIPTYAMSCFQLPNYLLNQLQSVEADFWWHNRGDRRIHWVSWLKLCRQPLRGGLGLRCLTILDMVSILAARMLLRDGCVRVAQIEEIGEDKNGRFTVKSTYRLAMDIRERDMPSISNGNLIMGNAGGYFWSSLWKSRVPPKAVLGTVSDSMEIHLRPGSALDWVTQVKKHVRGCEMAYFFMFCWTLWKLRCKRHMEGKHEDLMDAWRQALIMLENYQVAHLSIPIQPVI